MRFDKLDLNLLVVLDALLEQRSVSAAARQLHLSQPAVTSSLNRLRDFFGDELLQQSGRAMIVTAKGETLAAPVRRALMQIRTEITRPGEFDPATSNRRFRIAASDFAYSVLLADVLAAATREAPGTSFEIIPPGSAAIEQLDRAEIDLFLTVAQLSLPRWPHLALFRDDEVAISWTGANYGDLSEDAFFGAAHAVALFGSDRQLAHADRSLAELPRARRIEVMVPSFSALPQAIVGTRRLATMHRLYAEHCARLYPIVLHPMPVAIPDIVEIAQWHSIRDHDRGLAWLLSLLRDQVMTLPASAQLPAS